MHISYVAWMIASLDVAWMIASLSGMISFCSCQNVFTSLCDLLVSHALVSVHVSTHNMCTEHVVKSSF